MLTIRREQLEALEEANSDAHNRNLAKFFRNNSPKLVERMDDVILVKRIGALAIISRTFGITSPEGTAAYVALGLAAGSSFDRDASVRDYLRMPGASPEIKVRTLFARVASRGGRPIANG
jgi:hypothetical protein